MLAWQAAENTEISGETAAHEGAAGHAEPEGSKVPELPNLLGVIHGALEKTPSTEPAVEKFNEAVGAPFGHPEFGFKDPLGTPVTAFENVIFAFIYIAAIAGFFISGFLKMKKSPKEGRLSRRAMFIEVIVMYFDDFFAGILGKTEARKHLPFLGTLFIYIFVCNTMGLIWLGKAPTANLSFNAGMALLVFLYVHVTCITRSPVGYLAHFPGTLPSIKEIGPIGYFIVPFMAILFTIIHILEVFIQPLSLSLRLYGNILGKDVLLGVFATLLIIPISKTLGIGIGLPLHTPFLFLGLLLGSIQAMIFSLLTAVYISMWLPHDHAHEHGEAHAAHGDHH
jgi:F-type H+-transporting ATPase subunit a